MHTSTPLPLQPLSPLPVDSLKELEEMMRSLVSGSAKLRGAVLSDSVRAAIGHFDAGGQRVRARLALRAGEALGLTQADSVVIGATVELLHNASLVHDDLQDRERIRRGTQTVWAAYGDEVAICTGDLLLSSAYGALAAISDPRLLPELIALVHARTAMVIRGQSVELSARGQQTVDMADYEQIVVGKSGALLSLPLEMALLASGKREWMEEARCAAEAFGISYQIMDDLEDVESDAAGDAGPRAVNALLVLRAAGYGANAEAVARDIGLRHLRTAVASAGRLPNGSGAFLQELTMALAQRL